MFTVDVKQQYNNINPLIFHFGTNGKLMVLDVPDTLAPSGSSWILDMIFVEKFKLLFTIFKAVKGFFSLSRKTPDILISFMQWQLLP